FDGALGGGRGLLGDRRLRLGREGDRLADPEGRRLQPGVGFGDSRRVRLAAELRLSNRLERVAVLDDVLLAGGGGDPFFVPLLRALDARLFRALGGWTVPKRC